MFVQSYNRGRAGKYVAKMLSPTLHIPKACLSFDYKMEGRNINKLKLRLVDSARITRVVPGLRWSKRGNHGSQWLNARVNINRRTTDPYKVTFLHCILQRRFNRTPLLIGCRACLISCFVDLFSFENRLLLMQ